MPLQDLEPTRDFNRRQRRQPTSTSRWYRRRGSVISAILLVALLVWAGVLTFGRSPKPTTAQRVPFRGGSNSTTASTSSISSLTSTVPPTTVEGSGPESESPPSTSSMPSAEPGQTLVDVAGAGTTTTKKFTADGGWDVKWSYDCKGRTSTFAVEPTDRNLPPVRERGTAGSGTSRYESPGTYQLNIVTDCSWVVTVLT